MMNHTRKIAAGSVLIVAIAWCFMISGQASATEINPNAFFINNCLSQSV